MNEPTETKVDVKFAAAVDKLTAVLGGKDKLKRKKRLPKDQLGDLVTNLFAEEEEKIRQESKEKLKALLVQFHELERFAEEKRKELDKLVSAKKEEFVKAATSLFEKIEGLDDIYRSYYSGLKEITKNDTPAEQQSGV